MQTQVPFPVLGAQEVQGIAIEQELGPRSEEMPAKAAVLGFPAGRGGLCPTQREASLAL